MKIERKKVKKEIISYVEDIYINDIKISDEFLLKNNLQNISYGGGGILDEKTPWLVRFLSKINEKRYSEYQFEVFFNNLVKCE